MADQRYAWCGYWNGACKALVIDRPAIAKKTIAEWMDDRVDFVRRLPLEQARKELSYD